jgi:hypothetical protein
MNGEQFVNAIQRYVRDASVANQIASLNNPPGRRPPEILKRRSEWFRGLSADQQEFVKSIIADAVNSGIFGLLCVIDGVRVVDDEKGRFELRYIATETSIINESENAFLHDIYNAK